MKYKNSSFYVQRQVDRLFRDLFFVKAFIDDIIIYSRFMKKHLDHLNRIFIILINNEIFINLKKIFLSYSFVQLLDQKVNFLNLTTDEKKLKTIARLKFLRTLKQLKIYLELTNWMKEYVLDYVEISQSLQNRKTLLLKSFSLVESIRRKFSFFTRIMNSTFAEKQAYDVIQLTLFKSRHLTHSNIEKQLYEDIDVNKKFDIEIMIYHVKNENDQVTLYFSKSNILLILFLSRQLKFVEKNYWSIELEIANIVFIIRKIRHMIESFKKLIILFTNHESAVSIVKQISLSIISTDRLNLRLIRVFEYIQRFNVIIKHKFDKQHIVSDALSRLASENDENVFDSEELNALIAEIMNLNALFIIILVEMSDEFRIKIISEYFSNSKWRKLRNTLEKNFSTKLSFTLNDHLIYRIDHVALEHAFESRRLCISKNLITNILHLTHFDKHYSEFIKCYDIIFAFWYIHDLVKHLREYLRHCFECQIYQTRRVRIFP